MNLPKELQPLKDLRLLAVILLLCMVFMMLGYVVGRGDGKWLVGNKECYRRGLMFDKVEGEDILCLNYSSTPFPTIITESEKLAIK